MARRRGRPDDDNTKGAEVGAASDAAGDGRKAGIIGPDAQGAHRLQHGVIQAFRWTVRLLVIGVGLFVLFWLMGQLWSILLPILFGLLLATILWPPVRFMRKKLPNALAAFIAIVALFLVVIGLVAVLAPQITSQAQDLLNQATAGLKSVQQWVAGPPLNFGTDSVGGLIDKGINELQANSQEVVGIVLNSLGAIGSAIVTLVLALVLCFFFLKDGPRFLPWLRTWIGPSTGEHIEVVSNRVWTALGQYVWSQAAVALVDAFFIGMGVWLLGVPFALPIAVLTFFGGFVPIVGAFVAGAVATLVALVSNGVWTAVAVLVIVLVVQQLEGNVMQPILVGKTLKIHPAVVLTSVALGGTIFGIVGAFLAVPAVAAGQVVTRYIREQLEQPPPSTIITDVSATQDPHSQGTG